MTAYTPSQAADVQASDTALVPSFDVTDDVSGAFARQYGRILLPRPLVIDRAVADAFAADLTELHRIIVSLTPRLFDGDLRRHGEAIGIDATLAEVLDDTGLVSASTAVYARADAFETRDGFKILELNVGSELGGTESAVLGRAFLNDPDFAQYAEQQRLTLVDSMERLVPRLVAAARAVCGDEEPVVALLESPGNLAAYGDVFTSIAEAAATHGLDLMLGEITDIAVQDQRATLRGRGFHAVLRFFVATELVERDALDALAALQDLQRAGRLAIVSALSDGLHASKANLALLHDPLVRASLTPDELRIIDRVVPWTRLVSSLHARAEDAALLATVLRERDRFMVKPGIGYSGVGAVMGRDSGEAAWRRALHEGPPDLVVQEVVDPVTESVIDLQTGEVEPWVANWGIFVDEGGYAGAFVRALRPGDGSIISFSNPGTRFAATFVAEGPTGTER